MDSAAAPEQKWLHLRHPGDILVDDHLKHRHLLEVAGGTFIHHTSAEASIERPAALGLVARESVGT